MIAMLYLFAADAADCQYEGNCSEDYLPSTGADVVQFVLIAVAVILSGLIVREVAKGVRSR
jgi:hypothetical protein